MESNFDKINNFVEKIKNSINCQCPAKVDKVNEDGTVDVIVFRNDEITDQKLPHVKIKHIESGSAFVFLGVSQNDYGLIRYFDRSIENYVKGIDEYNDDDRCHDLNDACFELGFIPNPSSYVFPVNNTVAIGNKDGKALISIDTEGNINITGGNINITGAAINLGQEGAFVLTEKSVITDSRGGQCTIQSNTTITKAV